MRKESLIYQKNISYLRIIATISVIWLHTCSTLAENTDLFYLTQEQIVFFTAAYQMMYWAVPVFFMITGILLLDPEKRITAKQYFAKYCMRILLALIIFGIPFAMLKITMERGDNFNFSYILLAVKAVLGNNGLSHFWYLYILAGVYLVLPVLRSFVKNAKETEVKLIFAALFVMDFVFPLVSRLTVLDIAFDFPLKYPLFYVLAGYYIYKKGEKLKKHKGIFISITAICIISIWVLNYMNFMPQIWTAYDSPLITAMAISIFVLALFSAERNTPGKLWSIDRLCFGAYIVHPIFIQFTYRVLKITPVSFELYPITAVLYFTIFVCCGFTASWIMWKIMPLRKYVL